MKKKMVFTSQDVQPFLKTILGAPLTYINGDYRLFKFKVLPFFTNRSIAHHSSEFKEKLLLQVEPWKGRRY